MNTEIRNFLLTGTAIILLIVIGFGLSEAIHIYDEPIETEPIIQLVDHNVFIDHNVLIEVPVFGCPQDYNAIVQQSCIQLGNQVQPVNQAALEEIQNAGGVCEQTQQGVICNPCLQKANIGWSCIDANYMGVN